jgi:putative ABC transport system substrate-binding protein
MGQIDNLARPGGNATGFTPFAPSLGSKWIELMKELSPRLTHVGIIFNPDTAPNAPSFLQFAQSAASSTSISVSPAPVRNNADIEMTMADLARTGHTGAVAIPDPFTTYRAELMGSLALRHSIPLVTPFRDFTTAGGLASYGINDRDEYRRAATYVDRILRGEKPADLPVQAPTKFDLVINLKVAKALGLNVPLHLQQLADEVIE